jgi:hypothetical protein
MLLNKNLKEGKDRGRDINLGIWDAEFGSYENQLQRLD